MRMRRAVVAGTLAAGVLGLVTGVGLVASGGPASPTPSFDPNQGAKPCTAPLVLSTVRPAHPPTGNEPVSDCYIPASVDPNTPASHFGG